MKNLKALFILNAILLSVVGCKTRSNNDGKIEWFGFGEPSAQQKEQLQKFEAELKLVKSDDVREVIYTLVALDRNFSLKNKSDPKIVPQTIGKDSVILFARPAKAYSSVYEENWKMNAEAKMRKLGPSSAFTVKAHYQNILSYDQLILGNRFYTWSAHRGAPSFEILEGQLREATGK